MSSKETGEIACEMNYAYICQERVKGLILINFLLIYQLNFTKMIRVNDKDSKMQLQKDFFSIFIGIS